MSHDFDLLEQKQKELLQSLDIKPRSVWRHYKGDYYVVERLVMKESTEELEVCYSKLGRPLPCSWTRPVAEWKEQVKFQETCIQRFTIVKDLHIDLEFQQQRS